MLAVVTNYYNPNNRPTKAKNFTRFLEGMKGKPLHIVEAAFGNEPFQIADGDNVLHVRCPHVLWQQYRLVNLVVQKLPEKFDKAIWVDADILFDDYEWYEKMDEILNCFMIAQSFRTVDLMLPGEKSGVLQNSVAFTALENAKKPTAKELSGNLDLRAKYASGFSWGVQRDVIEKHGVYDYWITGSSDTAFVIGIWGDWKNTFLSNRLNQSMLDHYMQWAAPFHEYIGGSVSCLDSNIRHLWHGSRNYKKRWKCLKEFDPAVDIRIAENGVFEWATEKASMHACCHKMCCNYDDEVRFVL